MFQIVPNSICIEYTVIQCYLKDVVVCVVWLHTADAVW